MTTTDHTPGPWQISRASAGKNGTSLRIWRNDEGPDAPSDAGNTNYACIAQHVHREGDARLIAAAPDLLLALRCIAGYLDIENARAEARAAIARATGEA